MKKKINKKCRQLPHFEKVERSYCFCFYIFVRPFIHSFLHSFVTLTSSSHSLMMVRRRSRWPVQWRSFCIFKRRAGWLWYLFTLKAKYVVDDILLLLLFFVFVLLLCVCLCVRACVRVCVCLHLFFLFSLKNEKKINKKCRQLPHFEKVERSYCFCFYIFVRPFIHSFLHSFVTLTSSSHSLMMVRRRSRWPVFKIRKQIRLILWELCLFLF